MESRAPVYLRDAVYLEPRAGAASAIWRRTNRRERVNQVICCPLKGQPIRKRIMNKPAIATKASKRGQIYREIAVYLALLILTLATYWAVMGFDFVNYDDTLYVYRNRHVLSGLTAENFRWVFTSSETSNWHPLTWLSLMFDRQIFGVNPHAFHAVNLAFHIANSMLLLLLIGKLTGTLWRSAFVAALFALHPLHVESVAWVAERKDVLSTFFGLLTILAYIGYVRQKRTLKYLLVLLLFILGLMAKPMLVTLPLVLLLLDFWPLKRFAFQRQGKSTSEIGPGLSAGWIIAEKVPSLVLALASSLVTIWAQHRGGSVASLENMPISARVANATLSYVLYLGKMFWPAHLAIYYPYQPVPFIKALFAGALLALVTWLAVAKARVLPYFFVGWFWFLIMLLPVIGLVQVGGQALADRYSYLPLVGPFIILAWGSIETANHFKWPPSVVAAGGVALILACAVATRNQVTYWKNSTALFRHALQVTSNNFVAENNLALALLDDRNFGEANEHLQKGLKIKPTLGLYTTLASLDLKVGNTSGAVQAYRDALRLKPDASGILNNLAWTLATSSDESVRNGTEAVELAERACKLSQFNQPLFIGTLAAAYAEAGRFPDAISTAQRACDAASAAGLTALLKEDRQMLQIYRAGHAYHEPGL